jgi:hypothetical protein
MHPTKSQKLFKWCMNIATQHPHTWCIIMLNTSTQLQHCHCKFSQALYNVDNTQVRPMIISTSHRSSLLVLTLGMLAPSLTIFDHECLVLIAHLFKGSQHRNPHCFNVFQNFQTLCFNHLH